MFGRREQKQQEKEIMKILPVPYYSQNAESVDSDWRNRACGISCISMVMAYHQLDDVSIMPLINEGLNIGGYCANGWFHESLVRIMRNHGLHAYAEEYKCVTIGKDRGVFHENVLQPKMIESGILKIIKQIDLDRPVIVSVDEKFRDNKFKHIVVIVGYKTSVNKITGFYINDPDDRESPGSNIFISIDRFKDYWRKFAIFARNLDTI